MNQDNYLNTSLLFIIILCLFAVYVEIKSLLYRLYQVYLYLPSSTIKPSKFLNIVFVSVNLYFGQINQNK